MSIDRRAAAGLAEAGLAAVFDPAMVARLREDSPLEAVGITDADLVSVSDAVGHAAEARGLVCLLGDGDLDGVATVADLVTAIAGAAMPGGSA